jgi:hypothetical protein
MGCRILPAGGLRGVFLSFKKPPRLGYQELIESIPAVTSIVTHMWEEEQLWLLFMRRKDTLRL